MIAERTSFQFARFMGYAMTFTNFLLTSMSTRHYVEGLRQSSRAIVCNQVRLWCPRSLSMVSIFLVDNLFACGVYDQIKVESGYWVSFNLCH